mmetsp:Transcript_19736/g.37119  ORF Transcript_19736/g.37119 Transcript_19736/m.37119 type:complete len:218 (+) Transcript_19736:247-900(+)
MVDESRSAAAGRTFGAFAWLRLASAAFRTSSASKTSACGKHERLAAAMTNLRFCKFSGVFIAKASSFLMSALARIPGILRLAAVTFSTGRRLSACCNALRSAASSSTLIASWTSFQARSSTSARRISWAAASSSSRRCRSSSSASNWSAEGIVPSLSSSGGLDARVESSRWPHCTSTSKRRSCASFKTMRNRVASPLDTAKCNSSRAARCFAQSSFN